MTRKQTGILALAAVALVATVALAAEEKKPEMTGEMTAEMKAYMDAATPGPVHKLLAEAVGMYDLNVKSWPAPGAPAMEEKGTATRKMTLGGRVLVEEVTSSMMGMPFTGHGMHGFDNVTGKHWSTWNDNMGTGLMVSEGTCDDKGACTFTGSWNDPIKKGPITARMTTRWTSATTQVFEMFAPGPDGKEMKMMEITYTKKG
jgi:cytochrome c5